MLHSEYVFILFVIIAGLYGFSASVYYTVFCDMAYFILWF